MLKKLLLLLSILLIVACNLATNKNNSNESSELNNVVKPKELSVTIYFKTDKTDDFRIMLNNIEVDEFQKKNIHVIEKIIPTTDYSEIEAKFGDNNFSDNLVINLGKENEKLVEIKSIEVSYGQKSVYIDNSIDLKKYFALNKFVQLESQNKIMLKTSKINGQHNPAIYVKTQFLNPLFGGAGG